MKGDSVSDQDALDPHVVLGIEPGATAGEIREAYLRRVRENPPERAPEAFERIRDAFQFLSDERRRRQDHLFGGEPLASFSSLLEEEAADRPVVPIDRWLELLREMPFDE